MKRRTRTRLLKGALVIGFLALLGGTFAAFAAPARGYEISLYASTPTAYWAGLTVALVVALTAAFVRPAPRRVRGVSYVLAGLSVLTVVALPTIRGYFYAGGADAMTHLGWTRDIAQGTLEPTGLLYPGIHTITLLLSELAGVDFALAQVLMTGAFVTIYLLFIPLCARLLTNGRYGTAIGVFAGLLLLPVNNVGTFIIAHPVTQSIFLFPFVLFLLLQYTSNDSRSAASGFAWVTALAAGAFVLIHPQGALNVVFVFVTAAFLQMIARRVRSRNVLGFHRSLATQAFVFVVAFLLWAPRHERVQRAVSSVVTGLLQGSAPGTGIGQRSASLTVVGGSITGLFVKLFLGAAVFTLLATLLILALYTGRLDGQKRDRNALISYIIISIVPLAGAFTVFFAAAGSTQYLRYVGFLMVPMTILGVVALSDGLPEALPRVGGTTVRRISLVVLLLALPMSVATVHATPFIYQPTSGVSESQYDGFETAFEQRDESVPYTGVRVGPRRFLHFVYGTEQAKAMDVPGDREAVPGPVFDTNLTDYYDEPRYLPVTDRSYVREVGLYDGFRYSDRGFRALDSDSRINRIESNDGFRLYLLDGETE